MPIIRVFFPPQHSLVLFFDKEILKRIIRVYRNLNYSDNWFVEYEDPLFLKLFKKRIATGLEIDINVYMFVVNSIPKSFVNTTTLPLNVLLEDVFVHEFLKHQLPQSVLENPATRDIIRQKDINLKDLEKYWRVIVNGQYISNNLIIMEVDIGDLIEFGHFMSYINIIFQTISRGIAMRSESKF